MCRCTGMRSRIQASPSLRVYAPRAGMADTDTLITRQVSPEEGHPPRYCGTALPDPCHTRDGYVKCTSNV